MGFIFRKPPILWEQDVPSSNRLTSYHLSNLDKKVFLFPNILAKNKTKQSLKIISAGAGHVNVNQSLYRGACSDWLGLGHILTLTRNEGMRKERGDLVFSKRKLSGEW